MRKSARMYNIALLAARLSVTITVSYAAHVKTDMKAHEAIWNCGLVYSIDREKPHQLNTFSFVPRIYLECSDHMFVSGEIVC